MIIKTNEKKYQIKRIIIKDVDAIKIILKYFSKIENLDKQMVIIK